jgi:hypothetical protein
MFYDAVVGGFAGSTTGALMGGCYAFSHCAKNKEQFSDAEEEVIIMLASFGIVVGGAIGFMGGAVYGVYDYYTSEA